MTQTHTYKDLGCLQILLEQGDLADDPIEETIARDGETSADEAPIAAVALPDILAELAGAAAALDSVARRDEETRVVAMRDLARYDQFEADLNEAEQAFERAETLRREAAALAETAFAEEARVAAARVVDQAAAAVRTAEQVVLARRAEVEQFAAAHDLERLITERRRAEEAEKARAAAAELAGRLSGALTGAREALRYGRLEEAKALYGSVANESPDDAEVRSLKEMIGQRELTVKIQTAEEALRHARRTYRRDPRAAVDRLAALDVAGLPDEIRRQLFGAWAQACARLCREQAIAEPVRYAPDPGRGAVLAPAEDGDDYVVVSALGMGSAWTPGSRVGRGQVQRARPLR